MKERIEAIIEESVETKKTVLGQIKNIEATVTIMSKALKEGSKILVFGNGGSAADSQHIVAELVGRFKKERRPLAALALTTNTSTITAVANDYDYDTTFSRQIEALGRKGDVVMAISTSGNSKNVIAAALKAKSLGMKTVGLVGGDGGRLAKECDVAIVVNSRNTPRIQESHIMIGHIICELIEDAI